MATHSQVTVKKENDGDSTDGHSHHFTVKFSPTDYEEYTIDCDQPRTVLQPIQSTQIYNKKMKKCSDETIVIQLGKEDKESIVATQFPCSFIDDGVCVIIPHKIKQSEKAQKQHNNTLYSKDNYSNFYTVIVRGENTILNVLFKHYAFMYLKYLCVSKVKGPVAQALKRVGFIDQGDFTMSDNKSKYTTRQEQKVDNLHQIVASNNSHHKCHTTAAVDVAHQKEFSVRAAVEKSGSDVDIEEIYERLCEQYPGLKEWMESRFPGDYFKKELNLRKENFGKKQSFSEVHRVKKLLKLGESVCKLVVEDVCVGTGFVLFDNFILTNAHLFKDCVKGQQLKEGINVFALFNYEDPEPHTNFFFPIKTLINYSYDELDYAILELNPEGHKPNQTTQNKLVVPPGLLDKFGSVPPNGEACIIGYPAGGVKKMDPTFIIEKEKRKQAVNDHLRPYKDSDFIVESIYHLIKQQGIDDIIEGGNRADRVITYNTFMYHGSSGSPVFDACGRVFGLHTGGYTYGFPKENKSVIEYAQPLLTIFEHFVRRLRDNIQKELFYKFEEAAKGNWDLEKILVSVCGPKETRKRKASSSSASGPKAKRTRTELPQP